MTTAIRIPLDTWQSGYPNAIVEFHVAGTTDLAAVWLDEAMTLAAENPQRLIAFFDADGYGYGKLALPVYAGVPVEIVLNTTDQSGVLRPPLVSLAGEDASGAMVTAPDSTYPRTLADHVGKEIHAADYGPLGESAVSNTETITIAIGVAAAQGGGYVILPPMQLVITTLTIPAGVVLRGQGELATMLISQEAQNIVTIGGDDAGLQHLTLDGVVLIADSIGVYSENRAAFLDHIKIQRFDTGLHLRGGAHNNWTDTSVSNCHTGAKLKGDTGVDTGVSGAPLIHLQWNGGTIDTCTAFGVDIGFHDALASNIALRDISFESNIGMAAQIQGAQFIELRRCRFINNETSINFLDAVPDQDDEINLNKNAQFFGCRFETTTALNKIAMQGRCQNVVFANSEFLGVYFELTLPQNQILLLDCLNDGNTVIVGDSTKLVSRTSTDSGSTVGVTTDAAATKVWSSGTLEDGQICYVDITFLGNSRNSNAVAKYRREGTFRKPQASLNYDGQVANFTLGTIVRGDTSGASARILADTDTGVAGTLFLRDVTGTFLDNEVIRDSATGVALANGTNLDGGVVVTSGAVAVIGTDVETVPAWDVAIVGIMQEVEARVTGAAGTTIEWTVTFNMIKD